MDGVYDGLAGRLDEWKAIADKMPSIRTASRVALSGVAAAQSVLGFMQSPVERQDPFAASATCSNPQLSCQNTTAQNDLCCFNSPGGALLLTQFWDTDPVVGPADSWTVSVACKDHLPNIADNRCRSMDYGLTTAMAHMKPTAMIVAPTPTSRRSCKRQESRTWLIT